MQVDVGQQGRQHSALGRALFARPLQPVFQNATLEDPLDQPQDPRVPDASLQKASHPLVIDVVEKSFDVRFGYVADLAALDGSSQLIQCIVLLAPRPISVTTVQKIRLIDGLQHPFDRSLDQLVLKARYA